LADPAPNFLLYGSLGGRWKKHTISTQDIADVRKEIWQGLGDKL